MKKTTLPIQIGSLWTLVNRGGDPWDAKPVTVKIIDVRAGWVRYQVGRGLLSDVRDPIGEFLQLYQPVESDWPEEIDAG